jgi:uncharacterized protein YabE (DUF348 family)
VEDAVIDPEQSEHHAQEPDPGEPGDGGRAASRRGHPHGRRVHRSSRTHLRRAVRPSPARAEPHDSGSWLPLPDVDGLPEIEGLIATTAGVAEAHASAPPTDAVPAPPSPARARPHDATAWFPLPVPDELPSIDEMLTQSPWDPKPSPARAEPHDAAAWLPLPDTSTLPAVDRLVGPSAPPVGPPAEPFPPPPALAGAPARSGTSGRRLLARLARPRTVLVVLLLLCTVGLAGFGLRQVASSGSSVEVRVDGRRVSLDSGAATVGALLRERRLRLGEFDRVVPARDAALRDGLTVTVLRGFPITRDLDGDIQTVYTTYASPSDYVRRELRAADTLVIRSAPQRLQAESTIILRTPHRGRLVVDGAAVDYDVPALDIDELLAQYSIELGPEDYVLGRSGAPVGRDTRLVDGAEYSVVRVGREIVREDEPYTVPDERRPDPTMNVGESRLEIGSPGIMSVSAEITRRNGEEVERKVISRIPTVVARPMITHYGTKADPMWDRIAQCETAGNWGMQGPMFSGGLGFYNGTWDSFGGRDFAPNAGLATREEQIIVAERLRSSVGIGGWGCAHTLGLVR